jgi:hypothetical protein
MPYQHPRTNTSDSDADLHDRSPPPPYSTLPQHQGDDAATPPQAPSDCGCDCDNCAPAEPHLRRAPSPSRFYRLLSDFQHLKATYINNRERFAARKEELAEAKTKASRYRDERDAWRQEVQDRDDCIRQLWADNALLARDRDDCIRQLRADNALLARHLEKREAALVNARKAANAERAKAEPANGECSRARLALLTAKAETRVASSTRSGRTRS